MNRLDRMVWVDLETTGLDPAKDVILELAITITDGDFTLLDYEHWVVARCVPEERQPAHPIVQGMHDKSGLWEECRMARLGLATVEEEAVSFLKRVAPDYKGPICGASPHFDMSFLKVELPKLAAMFNHRTFDVSTLKQFLMQKTGEPWPKGKEAHRALPDILESIEVAKQFARVVCP